MADEDSAARDPVRLEEAALAAALAGDGISRDEPIAEQVSARVIAMLQRGGLAPGDRLPTEVSMAEAFGISRPAMREALKALTVMGLIWSRQGGRYAVRELSPQRLAGPISAMFAVSGYDVANHFEARRLVDVELARLCAERASTAERRELLRLALDGYGYRKDPEGFRAVDARFHATIALGARNPLLLSFSQSLYELQIARQGDHPMLPDVLRRSLNQHATLAEAILERDGVAAAEAARAHLRHIEASTAAAMAR